MSDSESKRQALREFKERARGVPRRAELDDAAGEVLDAFDAAGVDSVLLKGPALVRMLYRPDEHRGYSDIDVLVRPKDLARARQALTGVGYRNSGDVTAVDDVAGILHAEMWFRLVEGESGVAQQIDLHWRLPGCEAPPDIVWEALAACRDRIELNERTASVLGREGLALHLATHAAQHGPDGLKPLADLVRGVERWPDDVWAAAARLAERVGGTSAFAAGLRLTRAGTELARQLELPPTDRLTWEILHRDARPRGTFHLDAWAQARGVRERANVLRRSLLPTREWISWEYPGVAESRARLLAAYARHLLRTPRWAVRAWRFRRRARSAAR